MNRIFNLKNVTYSYSAHKNAVSDISFSVLEGDSIALLGSNGSGKSTLLRLLNGLIFAEKGELEFYGTVLTEKNLANKLNNFRSKTGLIFQDSDNQLFCSSVFEEVSFALETVGETREVINEKTMRILDEFGLTSLKDERPWMLSGGEKKKTALASVLIYSPDVILLDEPTNSLDPRTRKWFCHYMKNLSELGKTIIISTNDLDLAAELTKKSIVLNENHKLEKTGDTLEILHDTSLLEKVNLI